MQTIEIKKAIRAKFTSVGCYQLFLVTEDGECLCTECARKDYRQIAYDHLTGHNSGWMICGVDHTGNMDEPDHCSDCGGWIVPSSMSELDFVHFLEGAEFRN